MTTLPTRNLGRDGPPVTRLGLGLAALGRPAYHNLGHGEDLGDAWPREALERHCHHMLDTAWKEGIRYVDVARSYGDGERFLRSWLERLPSGATPPVIGSKWGYTYVGDWDRQAAIHERKDHSRETFLRQRDESTRLLGDALRVYCIHSATLDSGVLDDSAVLDAMTSWKAQTGCLLGLTATGPQQADTLQAVLDRHADRFDVVHATFNLLEPSAGPLLAQAHAAGLGVVVKEGVANGRLTTRTDLPEVTRRLLPAARRAGTHPDALALRWILSHDFADVVLSGATTPAQLRSNLAAFDAPLDPETRDALEDLALSPETYWSRRASLPWT